MPHHLTTLPSQIRYVDVGSEPDVISQVPADVIGIVVDDDVVRIPEPAVTEANVIGSDREVETAKPEAARTTASKAPHMAATETTGESAMFPWMIQVVMSVAAASIMAHPFSAVVYVRSIGMSFPVVEVAVFLSLMRRGRSRRTVPGDVLAAATDLRPTAAVVLMATMLRHG